MSRRRETPLWVKRHIQAWRGYRGGIAWCKTFGGSVEKVKVGRDGVLDECPYHIAFCDIVSMDRRAKLVHSVRGKTETFKLTAAGRTVWALKRPVPGKAQCDNLRAQS